MSDVWQDAQGMVWYGYWLTRLDGSWGYLMHNSGADTDMGDLEIDEVHEYFGPLKHGSMVDTQEVVTHKRFVVSP